MLAASRAPRLAGLDACVVGVRWRTGLAQGAPSTFAKRAVRRIVAPTLAGLRRRIAGVVRRARGRASRDANATRCERHAEPNARPHDVFLVGERESDDRMRRDTNVQEIRRSINRERPTGGDEQREPT